MEHPNQYFLKHDSIPEGAPDSNQKEPYEVYIRSHGKFRGCMPLVKKRGEKTAQELAVLKPEFQTKFDAVKERMKKGWLLKMRGDQQYPVHLSFATAKKIDTYQVLSAISD
jgi:hypothetical protein